MWCDDACLLLVKIGRFWTMPKLLRLKGLWKSVFNISILLPIVDSIFLWITQFEKNLFLFFKRIKFPKWGILLFLILSAVDNSLEIANAPVIRNIARLIRKLYCSLFEHYRQIPVFSLHSHQTVVRFISDSSRKRPKKRVGALKNETSRNGISWFNKCV